MTDLYFEDFHEGRQHPLGPYKVTREAVIAFAREFDPQGIHLDDAIAEQSLLGGLAASGWHTCAMVMRMICDSYLRRTASFGAATVEEVRWLRPVRPGDTLSGTATVIATRASRSRPELGIVTSRFDLENDSGETVIVMTSPGFIRRRPQS